MPSSGGRAASASSPSLARRGEAIVGARRPPRSAVHGSTTPRRERSVWASMRSRCASSSSMRAEVAGRRPAAISQACRRVSSVRRSVGVLARESVAVHRPGWPAPRNTRPRARARAPGSLLRQARRDDVLAQDVLELDRLCRGRDVVGVELASTAYWSRMWLSWPSRRASSSSVSPRRARCATCSTSSRERLATAQGYRQRASASRAVSGGAKTTSDAQLFRDVVEAMRQRSPARRSRRRARRRASRRRP